MFEILSGPLPDIWQYLLLGLRAAGFLLMAFVSALYCALFLAALKRSRFGSAESLPLEGALPHVTVQVPVFNERSVPVPLLRALAALRYPRGRLEVQVLDDSTDETPELLAPELASLRSHGLKVQHLRRQERSGYKAGALQAGLRKASGDYLAVFDADFLPPPDFLERTVAHLEMHPELAFVQTATACAPSTSRLASWLSRGLVLLSSEVEQQGRAALGIPPTLAGSGFLLRRTALEAAGGWSAATLTEDLDLSLRLRLAGWRGHYLPEIVCSSRAPSSLRGLVAQQRRWITGTAQNFRRWGRGMLSARGLSRRERLFAPATLLSYLALPSMILTTVAGIVIYLRGGLFGLSAPLWHDLAANLLLPLGLASSAAAVAVLWKHGRHRLREALSAVGAVSVLGLMLVTTAPAALWRGTVGSRGLVFEVTPKGS